MEDDEDLYGDLEDTKCAPPVKSRPPSVDSVKVEKLQKELDELRQENEILKRNMGTLFRTARVEVKRKDAKIESLMEELDRKHASFASGT